MLLQSRLVVYLTTLTTCLTEAVADAGNTTAALLDYYSQGKARHKGYSMRTAWTNQPLQKRGHAPQHSNMAQTPNGPAMRQQHGQQSSEDASQPQKDQLQQQQHSQQPGQGHSLGMPVKSGAAAADEAPAVPSAQKSGSSAQAIAWSPLSRTRSLRQRLAAGREVHDHRLHDVRCAT